MESNVTLNSVWTYLQSLSLSDQNKEWLASKLIESRTSTAKPYTIEELDKRLFVAEEQFEAGETFSTDDVIKELKELV